MGEDIDLLKEITTSVKLILEYKGREILNEKTYRLLLLINKRGSLYSAARALGVSYSRAWEWITKIEKYLGSEIILRKRGGLRGGGAKLSELGKRLLEYYNSKLREYGLDTSLRDLIVKKPTVPDILYVGSHEPLLEILLSSFARKNDLTIDFARVGSCSGLLALMLGEADISAIHLIDPKSGEYNLPYLRRYGIEREVAVIRGHEREMCLAYHPSLEISSLEEAIKDGYRLANRNVGSGTRILLDYLIKTISMKLGLSESEVRNKIRGYELEAKNHDEVAKLISSGKADYGILPKYVAINYGLKCIHLVWERYDILIPRKKMNEKIFRDLISFLRKESTKKLIKQANGYRCPETFGEILSINR